MLAAARHSGRFGLPDPPLRFRFAGPVSRPACRDSLASDHVRPAGTHSLCMDPPSLLGFVLAPQTSPADGLPEDAMRFRSPWLLLLIASQAAILLGCSKLDKVTAPVQQGASSPAPLLAKPAGPNTVPDGYIVVFQRAVPDVNREVDAIGQQLGVRANFRYHFAIKGFAATMPLAAVEALRRNPNVAYIEQDQIAHAVATQTNPTWGLDRIDQRNLPLSNSYTYDQTGAGVDAYMIDTGIRYTHTDFGGRAVFGFDAITTGGTAADDNGHGTHTAGPTGGATYGVAKGVRLISVKVLNSGGSGTFSQVIAGVDFVTGNHTTNPAVANMSLGGSVSTALDDAVRASI